MLLSVKRFFYLVNKDFLQKTTDNFEFAWFVDRSSTPGLKGVTIRYLGGGAGVFAYPFLFISQGRWKVLFFHLKIGWKYLLQYLYLFQAPLWKNIYFHHALLPFIYLTHFPHKNIYFQSAPTPHILIAGFPAGFHLWGGELKDLGGSGWIKIKTVTILFWGGE